MLALAAMGVVSALKFPNPTLDIELQFAELSGRTLHAVVPRTLQQAAGGELWRLFATPRPARGEDEFLLCRLPNPGPDLLVIKRPSLDVHRLGERHICGRPCVLQLLDCGEPERRAVIQQRDLHPLLRRPECRGRLRHALLNGCPVRLRL